MLQESRGRSDKLEHSTNPANSDMTPKIHHNFFQDCDVCEECMKTPNYHFKTCAETGTKCRRDGDCLYCSIRLPPLSLLQSIPTSLS